jgi:hypothetical protein
MKNEKFIGKCLKYKGMFPPIKRKLRGFKK